jgi:hypothetical protein
MGLDSLFQKYLDDSLFWFFKFLDSDLKPVYMLKTELDFKIVTQLSSNVSGF